jgi:hypothetical protein
MSTSPPDVAALPANTQPAFTELAGLLRDVLGEDLLSFTAFGGWLHDDPLCVGTPARSVAVVSRFDIPALDQLGTRGVRLGQRGVSAPLIMTPAYIDASRDVFPLELLEIKQLHATIVGDDAFAALTFEKPDVRLQCERELKSELIQLRQGVIAVGGRHERLGEIARNGAERTTRVLRGILLLKDADAPRAAHELVALAARTLAIELPMLDRVVGDRTGLDVAAYDRLYREITALSDLVDGLAA